MQKLLFGLLILVVAVVTAGAASVAGNLTKEYPIHAIGGSKQTGTITFQAAGSKTKVTISVMNESKSASEPAHIHVAGCKNPGGVKWPLSNVVGGTSVTVLSVSLNEATAAGTSVNIHKSAKELSVYMACGDIGGSMGAKAGGM